MANTEIKHQLNVQSMDNPLAKEKGEKRFVLIPNGIADFNRVIAEMMAVNPGFEREIVEAVVKLEHRTIQRLTLSGMRVSNGLFTAVASPKGRAGASWDPSVNQLNITISQGASWREAIRNTMVNVVGDKSEVMYISNVIDVSTQSTDRTATVGYPFFVEGNYLKIAGEDPSVGIFLINGEDEETRIDTSMIVINEPKKLAFILPSMLAVGAYTLRIVSQYSSHGKLVKTPHTVETQINVVAPATPPEDEEGEEEGVPHP